MIETPKHHPTEPAIAARLAAPTPSQMPATPNTATPTANGQAMELKITSDPAQLRDVRTRIEEFTRRAGFGQKVTDDIGLVVNEALANVIRHGYGNATDRPIVIKAESGYYEKPNHTELRLSIRDWAKPFDPATLPLGQPADLKPGGLGLLCMRRLMDEVEYSRLPDGMLLTMMKRQKGPERAG